MKKMKKILICVFVFVVLLSLLSLAFGAGAEETIITYDGTTTTYASFGAALNAADGGTLRLTADITISDTVTIETGKNVTLDLNNHTINCNNKKFAVVNGTLTIVDSATNTSTPTTYFVVESTGRWVKTDTTDGALTYIDINGAPASGSIIPVTGGLVYNANSESGSDTNGGCVMVNNGGTFNLKSGKLVGGQAYYGAGVYVHENAEFNMDGGAILGCYAKEGGQGAGVLNHSTFNMTGGTIAFNSATQYGGGICNYQTTSVCNITGGTIQGNSAVNGGGIYNYSTNCTISNASISYNTASDCGGGVYNNNKDSVVGVVKLINATVSYNTASKSGGGILSNGDTTVGAGTVVSYNEATENGGGIWANQNTFWLIGGAITNNKAGQAGGGVYYDGAYAFYVGGAAKVYSNTATTTTQAGNIYMASGKTISIYSPLTKEASIHVYRAEAAEGVVVADTKAYAKYFVSDQGKKTITAVSRDANNEISYAIEFTSLSTYFETGDGGKYIAAEQAAAFETAKKLKLDSTTETYGIKLLGDITVSSSITVGADENLNIDINGKRIGGSTSDKAAVNIFTVESNGSLTITNSATSRGVIGGKSESYYDRCYGSAFVVNGGTLNVENVIMQYIYNNITDSNGGCMSIIGSGAEATLTNCDILACTVQNGFGGGIYVSGGAKVTATSCKINAGVAGKGGGAVAVVGAGTATMISTTFNDNFTDASGAQSSGYSTYASTESGHVIYAVGSDSNNHAGVTVSMTNCQIYNYGYNSQTGLGNLRFENATCNLTESSISCVSKTSSVVYFTNSDFNMNGGSINGSASYLQDAAVSVYGTSKVTLAGAAQIGNDKLKLADSYSLTSNLTTGASVTVQIGYYATGKVGTADKTAENQAQYYTSYYAYYDTFQIGNTIWVDYAAKIGNSGYKTLQAAINAASGNTVKLLYSVSENITVAAGKTVTLDLNGKTVTAPADSPVITNSGILTVTDTSSGGTVKAYSADSVAIYNKDTKDSNDDTVSAILTLTKGNYYGSITSDDEYDVTLNGGLYSKDPVKYCKDATKTAVKCLGTGTYCYQVVATNTVNAVGAYATGEGFYVYDSVQSAIDAMPATTDKNWGRIAVTNDVTENIVLEGGYWELNVLDHTITAANAASAVITNTGYLILEHGTITGGSVGIDNTTELNLQSVSVTGNTIGVRQAGELVVYGTSLITGNTEKNLYLPTGKTFGVYSLQSGTKIGITTESCPTYDFAIKITSDPDAEDSDNMAGATTDKTYFESDDSRFDFSYNTDHWELVARPYAYAQYFASLTLKDNIDVNFTMTNLGSDFDIAKLTVSVDGSAITGLEYDNTKVAGILKAVAPRNMADTMNVEVFYDGTSIKTFDYSVREYCETVFADKNYGAESALGELCTAVLNYGKYAADYFNEKENTGVAASTVNNEHVIDFSSKTVTAPVASVTNAKNVVTYASAYLTLDSNIILNFRLDTSKTLTKDNITISSSGSAVSEDDIAISATSKGYIVTIKNISASKISNMYTLTINDVEESEFKVVYGIYNYCSIIQKDKYTAENGYTAVLKTLCKAIYNYGEASKTYAGS